MRVHRCASPVQAMHVGLNEGKILKARNGNTNSNDSPQILMYLQRLQHLVPTCPKDRPVTKLELIQYVIDYIYDLESVLSVSDSETDDGMEST